jgi:DNA-binding cell septation regulator SpoVG
VSTNSPLPIQNQGKCSISRVKLLDQNSDSATKAFVDVQVGPFLIHGFSVIRNKNGRGYFAVPPAQFKVSPSGQKKNYPYVTIDASFKEKLGAAIVRAYMIERNRPAEEEPEVQEPDYSGANFSNEDIPF